MKLPHLIAPLIALAGSAAWIYSQQKPLTDLEERTRILKERITKVKSLRDGDPELARQGSPGGKNAEDNKFLLPDGSLDWAAIAELTKNNQAGMQQDMRLMMRLQKKMMAMEADEIIENITRIRSLDLTDEIRANLESGLIMMLAKKDPEAAMNFASGSLTDKHGPQSWQMRHAFGEWSKKDPAAALAWMDKQIEEGKFVSKSLDPSENPRLEFETRLMGAIFYDDPAAIRKRLDQFTPQEQYRILQDHHQWRKDGKVTKEYLDLVREKGVEDLRDSLIGNAVITNVKKDGLESATKAIQEYGLSPEERKHAISAAIDNYSNRWDGTDADLTQVYPWVEKEDPVRAVELTAKALSNQVRHGMGNMENTFKTATEISENTGKPEIMTEFMKTVRNQGALEENLKQFKDEKLRAQYQAQYEAAASAEETE